MLALLISAVQLVPGLEFISRSPRATSGQTPAVIYDNSIHPARFIEGLWPNFFGTIGQGNHRWLEALPPTYDYQVWMESLYQGTPILILGLAAAGFRRGPTRRAWLTAVAIVGFAGSLGTYGSPLFWARNYSPLASVVGQNPFRALKARRRSGSACRSGRHVLADGHRLARLQFLSLPGKAACHIQPGTLRACWTGVG